MLLPEQMKNEMDPVVNRVRQSSLITLKLEELYPAEPIATFDLKDYLFQGLILREKDFRQALASHDWEQYRGVNLAVGCSADAIIPTWAYMLVGAYASEIAHDVFFGAHNDLLVAHYRKELQKMDLEAFRDARVVVKGCSDRGTPAAAFLEISRLLKPVVHSLFFGEPCSTVPVYKRPKTASESQD